MIASVTSPAAHRRLRPALWQDLFTSFWMLQYFSYSQATTVVEIVIFTSSWRVQFFSYTWMINHFFFFFCVTNHDFFVETTADTNWWTSITNNHDYITQTASSSLQQYIKWRVRKRELGISLIQGHIYKRPFSFFNSQHKLILHTFFVLETTLHNDYTWQKLLLDPNQKKKVTAWEECRQIQLAEVCSQLTWDERPQIQLAETTLWHELPRTKLLLTS